MLDFDLQRFDDEETVSNAEENSAEESSTDTAELPEGFEGLEEYKDEILADIAEMQKPEENPQAEEVPKGSIPYQRFKQVIDERNALKAQIDEMNKARASAPQQPQSEEISKPKPQPQIPFQSPVQTPPPVQITPEFVKTVGDATKNLAMKMANLTPEQVQEIENYGEDGDANFELWKQAKQYAAQTIYSEIQKARTAQAQQTQNFLNEHAAAVQSYNEFAKQEMQAPDFQNVMKYATGEYFDSLPEQAQKVIASSYVRIQRQNASPAEFMLVQNFYNQAKAAYQNKNLSSPKGKNPAPKANLPKVDQLNGSNGNGVQTMTVADLERIIDSTTDFDKLDPKIRKMFEG